MRRIFAPIVDKVELLKEYIQSMFEEKCTLLVQSCDNGGLLTTVIAGVHSMN